MTPNQSKSKSSEQRRGSPAEKSSDKEIPPDLSKGDLPKRSFDQEGQAKIKAFAALMKEAGFENQSAAARALCVTSNYVNMILHGKAVPAPHIIRLLEMNVAMRSEDPFKLLLVEAGFYSWPKAEREAFRSLAVSLVKFMSARSQMQGASSKQ